jgi:hypothetical protein
MTHERGRPYRVRRRGGRRDRPARRAGRRVGGPVGCHRRVRQSGRRGGARGCAPRRPGCCLSTVAGCVADSSGLDVERLLALRRVHGDECVAHYGRPAGPPGRLFTAVDADVVVPGARPGVIGRQSAESLPPGVQVVAPAANVPYTAAGADVLRRRGIVALPDFVCNAGAVIAPS